MTTKHHDDFGDRMKMYEKLYTERRLDTSLPIYARLDGRSFSSFTRKMERPFDHKMSASMVATMEFLAKETKADTGYTQSDEISLVWYPSKNPQSQFMFDGKIQKLASVLSSMCSASFMLGYIAYFGGPPFIVPSFDCRIINLPDETEAQNMLKWRMKDAFKNAVQSAAHYWFGHNALMGVDTKSKLEMLYQKDIKFFEEFPDSFKFGTQIDRTSVERYLTPQEMANIPFDRRPDGPVIRTEYPRTHPTWVGDKYVL